MNNAYLYIEDKKYPLQHFDFNFDRNLGPNLKPSGGVLGGQFNVVLEATKDSFLREWTLDAKMMKNGRVEIHDFTTNAISFKWEFGNAFATSQSFNYSAYNNSPLITQVTINAGIVRINREVLHENNWNPNDPFEEQEVTTVVEDDVKKITDYYLTDKSNNRIDSYDIGDIIVLNIETQNRIGDVMTINLNDNEHDFKQGGIDVVDDIIENISIGSDLEQIELEVVTQQTTT